MDPGDLYAAFRRALRAEQLYPEGNRVREETRGRLMRAVDTLLLERAGAASLAFLEDGAYAEGARVPVEREEDAVPLARRLFDLGLRELRFLPGIRSEEIERLLGVLGRALQGLLNPVDEDLPILLWDCDLGHVGYLLYEDRPPAGAAMEGPSEEEGERATRESKEDLGDYVDPETPIGDTDPTAGAAWLTEAERFRILGDYRREVEEEIPFRYGRLLIEILRHESEPEEVEPLRARLLEYLDALVSTDRFEILARLEISAAEEGAAPDRNGEALAAIRGWYRQSDIYIRAARSLAGHPKDREAASGYLDRIPVESLPDLIGLLLDERAGEAADALGRIRRQVRDPAALEICLADPRSEVRRLALEEAVHSSVTDGRQIREILNHPDPGLRVLAAQALAQARDEESLTALTQALEDPEEPVRIAGAQALGARGGSRVLERLLRVVVSPGFARRGLAEKRAFFYAAGEAAPREVLPVLAQLAEQRGFWPSRERRERSQAALEALSRLGDEVRPFLEERWSGKRGDLLRRFDRLRRNVEPDTTAGRREAA
jgi:hypothetical protein